MLVVLAGCGDGEQSPVARTQPPVGAPPTTTPSPTPTPTATATETATPAEEQEGGAGDEEAPRVPVDLTVDGEGITPPRVEVPPSFPLEITVRNDLDREVVLRLEDLRIEVPAHGRERVRHPGLRKGDHEIGGDGVPPATIVAGGAVGP